MSKIFKALFGWLFNRWVVSVLALFLLALLIWFVGPLIAFAGWEPLGSADARWVTIILITSIWLIKTVWAVVQARRTNAQMVEGLATSPLGGAGPEDQASEEEVAVLRDRFAEALGVLKKAKLGGRGGRRQLYQLPWYLIIGPPGAGKTTALRNSGLKFPLMERFGQGAIQGVGGTRNCDWWFTDEAVLLDTAGRYTTQDSDQAVDSAAWGGFLQLLKRHRRRRPIDGVIVAFSLVDLTQQRAEERQLHAQAVRKRLQELSDQLKVKVPVYVVFTKCDLVAGFIEFFDDLGREERGQVWGVTFPIAQSERPEGVIGAFEPEFANLMDRLEGRLLTRLDNERDLQRRGAIHGFTQQMASLKEPLKEFLAEAFQPSRFEEAGLVRGVYFSSGTQEGTPIDRIISSVSATFGLDRQAMPAFSGPGRSYFLTRLLRDVVFQEADLVGNTGLFYRYRPWFQRGAYAGAAVVLLALAGAWTASYLWNQIYISEVETQVAQYEQDIKELEAGDEIRTLLQPLDQLRSLPGGFADRDKSVPLLMGLGLYQGDKLGVAGRSAYRRGLSTMLMPRVLGGMETQMRDYADHSDILYETLKAYLMIGNPKFLDRDFVKLWVTLDWNQRLPGVGNAELRDGFAAHLAALLEGELVPPALNPDLVRQARDILARRPLAERVYAQVKREAAYAELDDWRMTDKIGEGARQFQRKSGAEMTDGIPGLFTYDGYKDAFLDKLPEVATVAASETWVLGPDHSQAVGDSEVSGLSRDISGLYFTEYINQWTDLLEDLEVVSFRSAGDAVNTLKVLSAPDSPVKALLNAVVKETTLNKQLGGLIDLGDELDKIQELQRKFLDLLGRKPDDKSAVENLDPSMAVDRHFDPLHDVVKGNKDNPAQIEEVIRLLNELYIQVSLDQGLGDRLPSPEFSNAVARLRVDAQRRPEPLARWMRSVALETQGLKERGARRYRSAVWQSEIAPYCRRALAGRYPFSRGAERNANMNDFARYFGPQGMVDGFFKQHLQASVDTSVVPWQPKSKGSVGEGALRHFETAAKIREAFFAGGGPQPNISFQIKPLGLDKAASQVLLELGDQRLTYRHGPIRFQRMQWPPQGAAPQARLVFTTTSGAASGGISAEGPWALFRLLDKGKLVSAGGGDRYKVTFTVNGVTAVFQIQADSVFNPFRRSLIGGFRCLAKL